MPKLREITVPLRAELHEFLKRKMEQHRSLDAVDVIREALEVYMAQEDFIEAQRRQFRREIEVGLEQARVGQVGVFNAAEIKKQGRRRLRSRRKAG